MTREQWKIFFICSVFLLLLSAIAGAVIGWLDGIHTIRRISEDLTKNSENVCGTGFPAIVIGNTLFGMIKGSSPGMILALLACYKLIRKTEIRSDWAAYYGG